MNARQLSSKPRVGRTRWLLFLGKAAVTVAFLAFLLFKVDLSRLVGAARESLGIWLLLAVSSSSLMLVVSALKWHALLKSVHVAASRRFLLGVYTIGFFASSLLPGVVGGDVVRWSLTGQRIGEHVKVAATILAERVLGVVALVLMTAPIVLLGVPELSVAPVLVLVVVMAGGLGAGIALALNRRLAAAVAFRSRRRRVLGRLTKMVYRVHRTLRQLSGGAAVTAIGYSVLFYVVGGIAFYFICRAFDADVSVLEAVAVQLLTSLITLLPISVGGMGLAQVGDVFLLDHLGITFATALGISMTRILVQLFYAGLGGILFIRWMPRRADGEPVSPGRTYDLRAEGPTVKGADQLITRLQRR